MPRAQYEHRPQDVTHVAEDHGVALSDMRDIGACAGHYASALVAAHHREWHRDVAGDQMLVGVA